MTDVTKDQLKTDQNANKAVNNYDPSKNKQGWNTEPTTPKKDQETTTTPTTPATK